MGTVEMVGLVFLLQIAIGIIGNLRDFEVHPHFEHVKADR